MLAIYMILNNSLEFPTGRHYSFWIFGKEIIKGGIPLKDDREISMLE